MVARLHWGSDLVNWGHMHSEKSMKHGMCLFVWNIQFLRWQYLVHNLIITKFQLNDWQLHRLCVTQRKGKCVQLLRHWNFARVFCLFASLNFCRLPSISTDQKYSDIRALNNRVQHYCFYCIYSVIARYYDIYTQSNLYIWAHWVAHSIIVIIFRC